MSNATTEVLMPLMGEGITEATLVKWLKKPGEAVKKEEPLLEISTDKVDTEIPAPASGFLVETFANDGDMVQVNAVIAHIAADANAKAEKPASAKSAANGATKTTAKPEAAANPKQGASAAPAPKGAVQARPVVVQQAPVRPAGEALRSSPLVRKMAQAKNIDLNHVAGSGLGGRITRHDLEAFVAAPTVAVAAPVQRGPAHLEYGRLETRKDGDRELLDGVEVRREKMSKMRGLIAEHMVRSVRTSPHVTTVFEIDMHKVVQAREEAKASFQEREGFNLTFTPFFVYAAIQAIKKHPVVNVSVDGEDILWKDQINVGVAVAIETGLIVPVVKNAGELNLLGVARRINDLATRARSKKLTPEDVQGGTFSITNPGMFGSIVSSPIINQPQVAIMSIGAIVKRPVVVDELIGVRPLVQVGLTFDHRVVDGEGGAKYLATLKSVLENFDEPI